MTFRDRDRKREKPERDRRRVTFLAGDFGYSRGLVKIGQIDSGADVFDRPGTLRVTMQRADGR